jgi:hypothetical protein
VTEGILQFSLSVPLHGPHWKYLNEINISPFKGRLWTKMSHIKIITTQTKNLKVTPS